MQINPHQDTKHWRSREDNIGHLQTSGQCRAELAVSGVYVMQIKKTDINSRENQVLQEMKSNFRT